MSAENEKILGVYAKKLLKSEMGKKLVRVSDLAKKLEVDPFLLSNKIARGKFSAGFLLEALRAVGTKEISIPINITEDYEAN